MNDLSQHYKSLVPEISLDRRGFVTAGVLASGYALAAGPVNAAAIKTSAKGLVAGEAMIPTKTMDIPAYYAFPEKGTRFPTVLVAQEIFGVHEYIKDVCRRLARQGYFAVAPELFVRQGDVSKLTEIKDILAIVAKVPDAQVMSDFDDTVAWAAKSGKANTAKLGMTGFCRGGRATWLYAEHNPNLKAAVAWYGPLAGTKTELTPMTPIEGVDKIKAAVLGLYGGADQGIPSDTVEAMKAALAKAGKTNCQIVVYPDTPHAFHADYRPSYREAQAKDGWKRLTAWFRKNLA